MAISAPKADERIETVRFTRDALVVDLADGRTISVPLTWYPKLLNATEKQRSHWKICGAGFGIHWPEIDEDLSSEGLLRGCPAPGIKKARVVKKVIRRNRARLKTRVRSKIKLRAR